MKARIKRNAVVVTMVVLVCAAAALNWKYAGQPAAQQDPDPAAQTDG